MPCWRILIFIRETLKEIARVNARLEALAQELLEAYQRWEYLEASKKENPLNLI